LKRSPGLFIVTAMNVRKHLTRRQFLKATSTIAAGAPLVLRSNLFGAESPSNRITLGFIGMGRQNRSLLGRFLRRTDAQVLAVCEVDKTRREHAQKMVDDHYAEKGQSSAKGCDAYVDFRELLARKDIDAVVIATPDHWHAIISIAAANAGKDIFCEKPLCQSIHEAQRMMEVMRRTKRVFQTGSMQRSMKEFRVAVELIRNGVIGKVTRAEVGVSGGPGVPCDLPSETQEPGLSWDLWLGPAPEREYHSILSPRGVHDFFPQWRRYREYGGGKVTDWGAHHFDIMQWALDMDESGPVEIFPPSDLKATTGARYVYANGAEITHVPDNGISIHGTEGRIDVNRGNFELWIGSEQKAVSVAQLDKIEAAYLGSKAKRVEKSDDHYGNWLDCIRNRKKPITSVEIGAHSVIVCHLVNLAYYHGQRIKWNPKKQTFADGTGNSKWMDVSYRAPWKLG
jgi:predicted dehydrogenase